MTNLDQTVTYPRLIMTSCSDAIFILLIKLPTHSIALSKSKHHSINNTTIINCINVIVVAVVVMGRFTYWQTQ